MKNKAQIYGVIGLLGVIGVGIGDFMMHYTAQGYGGEDAFHFFKNIPESRISIGHFLAVLFVPFYFAGYRHVYYILAKSKPQTAQWFFRIAVYLFTIGAVWIGSRAILSVMVKDDFNNGIEHYMQFNESLLQILRIGVVVISALYFYIVWSGKTLLPKWTAFFNPAVILGFFFVLFYFVPPIENILTSTAMSVAHFAFFSMTLYYSWQK